MKIVAEFLFKVHSLPPLARGLHRGRSGEKQKPIRSTFHVDLGGGCHFGSSCQLHAEDASGRHLEIHRQNYD